MQGHVDRIDGMFDTVGYDLPEPIVVSRVVSDHMLIDWVAGTSFTDRGYTSTSAVPEGQNRYRDDETSLATVSITLPAGTRVLGAGDGYERELILRRGSRFRINNITDHNISMELVG